MKRATASGRDKVTIKIPRHLYEKLQSIVSETSFRSVTDFAVYVLRDVASARGAGKKPPAQKEKPRRPPRLTEQEMRAILGRLRNLGYIE